MAGSEGSAEHHTVRRDRERELEHLRLRLLNQLDQRTGREKAVLRRTIAVLTERLRGRRPSAGRRRPRSSYSR